MLSDIRDNNPANNPANNPFYDSRYPAENSEINFFEESIKKL